MQVPSNLSQHLHAIDKIIASNKGSKKLMTMIEAILLQKEKALTFTQFGLNPKSFYNEINV